MFSLIITIIAIALVAALALASIYYGGSAFNKGSEKAQAATLVNNAMQVSAAMTLATADGEPYSVIGDLSPEYLASTPTGMVIGSAGHVVAPVDNAAVCDAVNLQSGYVQAASPVANADTAETTIVATAQFGCEVVDGTPNTYTFAFKH